MQPSLPAVTASFFVVFQLLSCAIFAEAVNLETCSAMRQENATQNGTDPATLPYLKIPYDQCIAECGSGMGDVNWQTFTQDFGAWYLPWISLMFQIPFGAEQPLDDVVSFLITIGSPALAGYSLQITHLNKYWIHKEFADIKYPNSKLIPAVLAAFHHIPIRVEHSPPFFHSLIALSKNDDFWSHLAAANKTRRWSIPLVVTYILVIFTILLTVLDSVTSYPKNAAFGISTVWMFLLPLVIGWLYTGCEPEPSHLRNSLASANKYAWVATTERDCPVKMSNPMAIEYARSAEVDLARKEELRPVPVFNYSRAFTTPVTAEFVLKLMKNAATNAKEKIPAGSSVGAGPPSWVENEKGDVNPENRVATVDEVVKYCTTVVQRPSSLDSGLTTLLEGQSPQITDTPGPSGDHGLVVPSRWAPGIWKRVAIASVLALGLQWGTTGAAIMLNYMSPPFGLGCFSLGFLVYGTLGTLSFFFFLTSSILAHMSRPVPGQVPRMSRSRTIQNAGAIVCRWVGKSLGVTSGLGILVGCFFQVSGTLENCFCTSTTFGRGRYLVTFIGPSFEPDSKLAWSWTAGLIMGFLTALLFGFSLYLALPPRRYK